MIFGIRQTSYKKDIWEYYMWILPIIWDIWVSKNIPPGRKWNVVVTGFCRFILCANHGIYSVF